MNLVTTRKRVVLTRTREGNEALAPVVRSLGLEPVSVESIEILPPSDWREIDSYLGALSSFDWLVFTSSRGVAQFTARAETLGLRPGWRGRPLVAAVGEGTAMELRASGISVSFVPNQFLTDTLASDLPLKKRDHGQPRVLLFRADIADNRMVEALRSRGFEVVSCPIYRTVVSQGKGEPGPGVVGADAILFASPSAVEGFISRMGGKISPEMRLVLAACIGPVTAKAARQHGFERIITPDVHTFEALLQELGRRLSVVSKANA